MEAAHAAANSHVRVGGYDDLSIRIGDHVEGVSSNVLFVLHRELVSVMDREQTVKGLRLPCRSIHWRFARWSVPKRDPYYSADWVICDRFDVKPPVVYSVVHKNQPLRLPDR